MFGIGAKTCLMAPKSSLNSAIIFSRRIHSFWWSREEGDIFWKKKAKYRSFWIFYFSLWVIYRINKILAWRYASIKKIYAREKGGKMKELLMIRGLICRVGQVFHRFSILYSGISERWNYGFGRSTEVACFPSSTVPQPMPNDGRWG